MTIWATAHPHLHDMAAANRTLSCEKKNKTSSVVTNSLNLLHISVRIYLQLFATLLSKPSRNSERSESAAKPGFSRIQIKPLITPWSSGVWRSTRLNAHRIQSSKRVPAGERSGICKTLSTKLQGLDHRLVIRMFCSTSAQLSFPPTRVFLMSPRCSFTDGRFTSS